jgi:hypothetical protein
VIDHNPSADYCRVCGYPPPHEMRLSKQLPDKFEVVCISCRALLDLKPKRYAADEEFKP